MQHSPFDQLINWYVSEEISCFKVIQVILWWKSEIFTLVRINIMTLCSLVHRYQWFRETYSLHVQGRSKPGGNVSKTCFSTVRAQPPVFPTLGRHITFSIWIIPHTLKMEAEGSLQRLCLPTALHRVTFHTTVMLGHCHVHTIPYRHYIPSR